MQADAHDTQQPDPSILGIHWIVLSRRASPEHYIAAAKTSNSTSGSVANLQYCSAQQESIKRKKWVPGAKVKCAKNTLQNSVADSAMQKYSSCNNTAGQSTGERACPSTGPGQGGGPVPGAGLALRYFLCSSQRGNAAQAQH